jgi:hypothetical protein
MSKFKEILQRTATRTISQTVMNAVKSECEPCSIKCLRHVSFKQFLLDRKTSSHVRTCKVRIRFVSPHSYYITNTHA